MCPFPTSHASALSRADAFESNILHFTVKEIDRIGAKFCSRCVRDLLQDGTAACHGAHAVDWALKGSSTANLLNIIRYAPAYARAPYPPLSRLPLSPVCRAPRDLFRSHAVVG